MKILTSVSQLPINFLGNVFFLLNLLKLIHSPRLTHYTSKMDVRKRKATAALVIASGFVSVEGKSKKKKKKLLVETMVVTDKGCLQHDLKRTPVGRQRGF